MSTLEKARRAHIEAAFQNHEFAEEVVGASGWEYDGQNHFQRTVFLHRIHGPSHPVVFYVEFLPDSATIQAADVSANC